MVVAIDPNLEFDFTLKEDEGAERPTVFRLCGLTMSEAARVSDMQPGEDDPEFNAKFASFVVYILSRKLKGWSALAAPDGSDHEFVASELGGASDASIALLQPAWCSQIALAALRSGEVDRDEGEPSGS